VSLKVILKETSMPFVTTVIILMIVSNVGAFLIIPSNMWLSKDPLPPGGYYACILQTVSGLMRDLGFNIGHWMFAYEYYMSAVSMEYIFMQSEMPDKRKKRLEIMSKLVYGINIGVVILYYFTLLTGNMVYTKYLPD